MPGRQSPGGTEVRFMTRRPITSVTFVRRRVTALLAAFSLAVVCYAASGYGHQSIKVALADACYSSPSHGACSGDDPSSSGCSYQASTVASQNWPSAGAQTTITLDTRWKG